MRSANSDSGTGIKKGDRVIVGLDKTPEELIAFAAAARLGALYIPVYTVFQVPEIDYYLHDSAALAVIGLPDPVRGESVAAYIALN